MRSDSMPLKLKLKLNVHKLHTHKSTIEQNCAELPDRMAAATSTSRLRMSRRAKVSSVV